MITTKTGDEGQTTCGGKRVDKDDLLVEVIGEIDELQAILELIGGVEDVVNDLSGIMGEIGNNKVFKMEEKIAESSLDLNKFVVFKSKKAKEMNWARTVCRRVERRMVALSKKQVVDKNILKYFNRLSDYLFIKAVELDK